MGEVIRKTNLAGRFVGYYIRFVDADGRRKARATKATSAAEARRILVELEATAGRRRLGIPDRPQPLAGVELIERWLEEAQPHTRDRRKWEAKHRYTLARVLPMLGVSTSRTDATKIVRKLHATMQPNTVRLVVTTLRYAWKWAVTQCLVDENPWIMRMPLVRKTEYLSREEVARLLSCLLYTSRCV